MSHSTFRNSSRSAFTLIELVIVVALIAVMTAMTFVSYYSRRNADDLTGAKQQLGAVFREAESRSLSEDNNVAWGVRVANATATSPFYALFSTSYSTATTAAYYRLPASVGMILVPSGLVGYWPLDEGSGNTALDYSGSGNVGTWSGSKTGTSGYYSSGAVGKWAGTFDGSTDYLTMATSSLSGSAPFTLAAWLKNSTSLNYGIAFMTGNCIAGQMAYVGFVTTAQAGTSTSIGGGIYGTNYGSGINDNNWHDVVMTFAGGSNGAVTLYVDGVQMVSTTITPSLVPTSVMMGKCNTGTAYSYSGLLDDARIYNRALSASEVAQLYNESADVLFSELTGSIATSTSVELYSLAQFGLSSTISIAPTGEVSF